MAILCELSNHMSIITFSFRTTTSARENMGTLMVLTLFVIFVVGSAFGSEVVHEDSRCLCKCPDVSTVKNGGTLSGSVDTFQVGSLVVLTSRHYLYPPTIDVVKISFAHGFENHFLIQFFMTYGIRRSFRLNFPCCTIRPLTRKDTRKLLRQDNKIATVTKLGQPPSHSSILTIEEQSMTLLIWRGMMVWRTSSNASTGPSTSTPRWVRTSAIAPTWF